LGRHKERVQIARMSVGERLVYDGEKFLSLEDIEPSELTLTSFETEARLHFRLPLRIKRENRLAKDLHLPTFIAGIHNRLRQLKGLEPKKLGYMVRGDVLQSNLRHLDLYRYSNRQRSRMKLGGLIGDLRLGGLDKQSWYYLKAGEILGAGKQTVFGLGSYTLIPIKERK